MESLKPTERPTINMEMIENCLENLFPNFSYRRDQKEVILFALHEMLVSDKKYVIINAPTGSGKSWIAYQISRVYNELLESESLILTKTISLQDQYLRDFKDVKKLMGANNFSCSVDYTVPIPPFEKHHDKCKYSKSSGLCEYVKAKLEYLSSPMKLLNYAFFFTGIWNYQTNGLLVVDEAHNFEEAILEFAKSNINLWHIADEFKKADCHLKKYLSKDFKDYEYLDYPLLQELHKFLVDSLTRINQIVEAYEIQLKNESNSKSMITIIEEMYNPMAKLQGYAKSLLFTVKLYSESNLDEYSITKSEVSDSKHKGEFCWDIKPIFIPEKIRNLVFDTPDKILLMSATGDRIIDSLKLNREDVTEIVTPYQFPLENRPIYCLSHLPPLNYTSFSEVYPKYVELVDNIISGYSEDTNIIIHTHSYKNAELYEKLSKHKKRVKIPTSLEIRTLEKNIGKGDIIVSPSITEGIDLGRGLARVQIFIKCPYPFLGDDWVFKKKELDKGWYDYKTALTIVQGSGRGIRSAEDVTDTFIIDPSFLRLFNKTKKLLPSWFRDTLQWL